ncbi:MAG: hypothetical protein PWP31_455 [Clostridia bacterium]|nr:hypothetical protein [Clostridia bacterium]
MRILLTTLNAKYIHVNLAIRYLKAYCRELPHNIKFEEFTINDHPEQIAAYIYQSKPELVAFSCYIWNLEQTINVINILKKVRPELLILCGGPEVSFETEEFLNQNPTVDFVIIGEGELSFRKLLEQLNNIDTFNPFDIPGLAFRYQGKIIINTSNQQTIPLEVIPFPYDDDIILKNSNLQNRTVYYECSRGCPFACNFCLSSSTSGLRYLPLERVKEDIKKLLAIGVKEIKFVDRTFNANKKRALAIWEFLISLKPRTRFYFEIAGDLLDNEVIDFLSKIPPNTFQFEIGVQTIDEKINLKCNRKQNWPRLAENIKALKKANNIDLHLDLIAGLPGETYNGVAKSFDAVYSLEPEEIQLGFLKLLKGTVLRNNSTEFGYLYINRPPYEVLASKTLSYEEMLKLHRIETLLKYYGNSHLVKNSLKYLVEVFFNKSYFAFYSSFADFWEEQQLFRQGHSQNNLFNILANFINEEFSSTFVKAPEQKYSSLDLFFQLLKYDFLCRDRSHHWPHWVPSSPLTKEQRSAYLKQILDSDFMRLNLPELNNKPSSSLRRHSFLELFPCNPKNPKELEPVLVLFYYGPPGHKLETYYLSPFKLTIRKIIPYHY